MRRQVITVACALAGIALAFAVGTVLASHLNSNTSPGSSNNPRWGSGHGFPGFSGGGNPSFNALRNGNGAFGQVESISGDKITVSSRFTGGTETVEVTGSTTYSKMTFGQAPTTASFSAVKKNVRIIAQGSKSDGVIVAKTITILPNSHRGGFQPGSGPGFWNQNGQSPGSGSGSGI